MSIAIIIDGTQVLCDTVQEAKQLLNGCGEELVPTEWSERRERYKVYADALNQRSKEYGEALYGQHKCKWDSAERHAAKIKQAVNTLIKARLHTDTFDDVRGIFKSNEIFENSMVLMDILLPSLCVEEERHNGKEDV